MTARRALRSGPRVIVTLLLAGMLAGGGWHCDMRAWKPGRDGRAGARSACDWSGTWDAGGGETLTLRQAGARVEGTYSYQQGRAVGTVVRATLIGAWTQASSYAGPEDAGTFEFEPMTDCDHFVAFWRHGPDGDWDGMWLGTRLQADVSR